MYQDQHDIEQPTNPEQYERLNTVVRKIRRSRKNTLPSACCCCLTTRLGSQLACLIWAGFSLYFACLGFMKKSPFYSYLNPVTLYIYAILNLIFFFINMVGFFIITWRAAPVLIGRLANIIWVFVILILIDTSANYLVFLVQASQYRSWCIDTSQNRVQQAYNAANTIDNNNTTSIPLDPFNDYYNCARLYQDEVTWGLLSTVTIILVYIHWAMVITSWEKWFVIQAPRMAQHIDIKQTVDTMEMGPNNEQSMDPSSSTQHHQQQQQEEDITHQPSSISLENEKSHYNLSDSHSANNIPHHDNKINNNNNNNNNSNININSNEIFPSEHGYYYPQEEEFQSYYPQDQQQYSYDPAYYYNQEQNHQQYQYPMNNNNSNYMGPSAMDPNLYSRY